MNLRHDVVVTNRLAHATSPYLLQHAENPVDWWEWSTEAFDAARQRDVPILLSVGYAACHWCHVMAHESFEDAETAALMNAKFVNIKVDREERPDVDAVYMQATQDLTGHGGWPMTVFIDTEGRPFYAGTYYPPEPRGGQPSFRQVLEALAEAWANRRAELDDAAGAIVQSLANRNNGFGSGERFNEVASRQAIDTLHRQFDVVNGGFGRYPKFPPSSVLTFLARHHARTEADIAMTMFVKTCEAMARGGIYDQLGGGFARYSVDAEWVVPHFEKMLYDNAQLIGVYTQWWKSGRSPMAARVVRESIEFLLRELRTDGGGFASALDADSDGAEGSFYVWSTAELIEVLGAADGAWAADLFAVTESGTFEHGKSTLQLPSHPSDMQRWQDIRLRLFAARSTRVRPARDDKVVTAWNGLAIAALAEAGSVFDEPAWVVAAAQCAQYLTTTHVDRRDDGSVRLVRTSRDAIAGNAAGVLEDYGDLAAGLLTLFQATGEQRWYDLAVELLTSARTYFAAPDGGFFDTASDADALVQRPRDPADNAYPSGHSAITGALLTYAALSGDVVAREQVQVALDLVMPLIGQAPRFAGWSLAVGAALSDGPREVAIVGAASDLRRSQLVAMAWQTPTAGAVIVTGPGGASGTEPALLAGRGLIAGAPTAYVCRSFVCDLPATTPFELRTRLEP